VTRVPNRIDTSKGIKRGSVVKINHAAVGLIRKSRHEELMCQLGWSGIRRLEFDCETYTFLSRVEAGFAGPKERTPMIVNASAFSTKSTATFALQATNLASVLLI
jgi:hypothetical protein